MAWLFRLGSISFAPVLAVLSLAVFCLAAFSLGSFSVALLFDLAADPGETKNSVADPAYAKAIEAFRQRRGELSYGPNADPNYINEGYKNRN